MDENQVVIKKNIGKQLLLLSGSILFVIASVYMINDGFGSSGYSTQFRLVTGIIGILFFGITGLFILFSFVKLRPALIINNQGITNNSSAGSSYVISWDNIKSLSIITVSRKKLIAITLEDNQKVFEQVNFLTRSFMKLNDHFYGSPAFITTAMIKMDIETLLKLIRDQKPPKVTSQLVNS